MQNAVWLHTPSPCDLGLYIIPSCNPWSYVSKFRDLEEFKPGFRLYSAPCMKQELKSTPAASFHLPLYTNLLLYFQDVDRLKGG